MGVRPRRAAGGGHSRRGGGALVGGLCPAAVASSGGGPLHQSPSKCMQEASAGCASSWPTPGASAARCWAWPTATPSPLRAAPTAIIPPDMLVAPIARHGELTVTYQLPTVRRGRVEAGPLALKLADPLGVSTRRLKLGEPAEALIYPAVFPIEPPPRLPGTTFDAVRRSPMAQSGDELYGLRPFQMGDDPRRIHWRSSAHHDELIVRQFEEFSHHPHHGAARHPSRPVGSRVELRRRRAVRGHGVGRGQHLSGQPAAGRSDSPADHR